MRKLKLKNKKAIVKMSGGIDSSVAVAPAMILSDTSVTGNSLLLRKFKLK